MDIKKFPELRKLLPIDIEKCQEYWDEKMGTFLTKSDENDDWKECKEYLEIINDDSLPVTARTYMLIIKIPYLIGNFIIEEHAKK